MAWMGCCSGIEAKLEITLQKPFDGKNVLGKHEIPLQNRFDGESRVEPEHWTRQKGAVSLRDRPFLSYGLHPDVVICYSAWQD